MPRRETAGAFFFYKSIEGRPELGAEDVALHQNLMFGIGDFDKFRIWHALGKNAHRFGIADAIASGC